MTTLIVSGPDGAEEIELETAEDRVVRVWARNGHPAAIREWLRRTGAAPAPARRT